MSANPSLWKWVIAPAVVTLLLLGAIIFVVARLAGSIVGWVTSWLPSSLQDAGSTALWIVVVIGLALGALLVFVAVVGIVAGPFCELLSEAVEQRVTGQSGPPFSLAAFVRGAASGLAHGLRRLVVGLVGFVLLFALGFVPVVGTIAALVIGGWLAARASAYDAYDAVLSRRELAYRDKLAYLARHRSRTLGLGATVAALMLVPGLNLLALGVGAVGATLAALEHEPPRS